MAAYFDTTDPDHLALLPEPQRTASELVRLAAEAERDVIGHYTDRLPTDTWQCPRWGSCYVDIGNDLAVYLKGYEVDSADADAAFQDAMRYTVARVLLWRLMQQSRDPSTTSETAKGTARTYRPAADAPFPRHWDRDLQVYDTRQPAWGL